MHLEICSGMIRVIAVHLAEMLALVIPVTSERTVCLLLDLNELTGMNERGTTSRHVSNVAVIYNM